MPRYSHIVEGRGRPEAALGSPGQSVPSILWQVSIDHVPVRLLVLPVLQSVETHEGQLSEEQRDLDMTTPLCTAIELAWQTDIFVFYSTYRYMIIMFGA